MAASPRYKVFNPAGKYVASCVHCEDAAAIVAAYGEGAEIRTGHAKRDTIFREFLDGDNTVSGESYDAVAAIAHGNEAMPPSQRVLGRYP